MMPLRCSFVSAICSLSSFALGAFLCGAPHDAHGALVTWDGGGANNNWSSGANWSADVPPAANDSILFDGSVRLTPLNDLAPDTPFDSLTFAASASSFVVSGNSLLVNGGITDNSPAPQTINLPMTLPAAHTMNVTAGGALTIGGALSGAGSLIKAGDGLLNVTAPVTFTGEMILDGGTTAFGIDTTLGNLAYGAATGVPFSTTASTLDLNNANLTAAGLNVRVNSAASNLIQIGNGKTFTINGPVAIGPNTSGLAVSGVVTRVDVMGADGNLVVNTSGNFSVGLPRLNADTGGDPFSTLDLSNLKSFTFDAGTSVGELRVGGGNVRGVLLLASVSNTITAAVVHVANSSVASASGNNNGGVSRLGLGLGANVINADLLNVGGGKSAGIFDFQGGTGTLTLGGRAGGMIHITVGNQTSATGSNTETEFLLAGHDAHVQAGTVIIGRLGGASNGTGFAAVTFDTGEFNVASLQLAVNATGIAPNGAVGSFTLGTDSTSTGVLNVTSQFFLANRTNTAQLTSPANGTFTINGGTANIGTDIVDASTSGDASTRNTTITLSGGTLNMMGHSIGSSTAPITTVAFPDLGQTATLANLGGTGINGIGLTLNNTGTLVLDGMNNYAGTTTINHGTLVLTGSVEGTTGIAIPDGTLRLGAANRIADSATLTLTTGTFDSAGFSDTLGAVTLAGSARIALGGGASILHFGDSSSAPWSGLLSVADWSGSPAGGGADQLYFGSNAAGLTANQIAQIQFIDPFGPGSGVTGARMLATGELVAIPEPSMTCISLLGGIGWLFARRGRRFGNVRR